MVLLEICNYSTKGYQQKREAVLQTNLSPKTTGLELIEGLKRLLKDSR